VFTRSEGMSLVLVAPARGSSNEISSGMSLLSGREEKKSWVRDSREGEEKGAGTIWPR
jgi:hypothetical protein